MISWEMPFFGSEGGSLTSSLWRNLKGFKRLGYYRHSNQTDPWKSVRLGSYKDFHIKVTLKHIFAVEHSTKFEMYF
jgi:hypothetical protein